MAPAMTMRWTWLVPSKICHSLASRISFSTGYSREYEIERLYRDVRITSIYEGSSQVQQMVISGTMLK
ncbi:Butyryl-CoA dehydrogenase [Intestinimonas butyriciproducens]|uniref:Butyryl-CoA dehydrogenase n=1 Tax=Intestinimonas butyriciproducens TaxID=1297617 RepID=A0A0S2W0G3_9FIRM|nr:Butyryl-CoA dehydrogenase [Intestinimonas butyriciproducens]